MGTYQVRNKLFCPHTSESAISFTANISVADSHGPTHAKKGNECWAVSNHAGEKVLFFSGLARPHMIKLSELLPNIVVCIAICFPVTLGLSSSNRINYTSFCCL